MKKKKKELSKEDQEFKDACKNIVNRTKKHIIKMSTWERQNVSDLRYLNSLFKLLHEAQWYLDDENI